MEAICELCRELFREFCNITDDPVLCRTYVDYSQGRVQGAFVLDFAVQRAGHEVFEKAHRRLVDRGILREEAGEG